MNCIMNHNEAPIADGYYWAKQNSYPEDGWQSVQVWNDGNGDPATRRVNRCGDSGVYYTDDFTFGPRIEEPDKCQLRDACERLLDAVKSEYETGINADGTPRYACCGEVIAIAERALGISTPPAAAQTGR